MRHSRSSPSGSWHLSRWRRDQQIVAEARRAAIRVRRGRRLAGQGIGCPRGSKHGAVGQLLGLNDVPVGVVSVGRGQAVRCCRRDRAAGRVIGVGCDVSLGIGDRDNVALCVVGAPVSVDIIPLYDRPCAFVYGAG